MPFKDGTYKHEKGFTIKVENGTVYVSPDAPLSLRLSELFNPKLWEVID